MNQERAAAEANIAMMTKMLSICREKTVSKRHTADALSSSEKRDFQNCILKFFETPNHVMTALQSAGGMQWLHILIFTSTISYLFISNAIYRQKILLLAKN